MPRTRAASATAAAWLPLECVTTPRAASASDRLSTAFSAPRALKLPVFWKSSHCGRGRPVGIGWEWEGWEATHLEVQAAARHLVQRAAHEHGCVLYMVADAIPRGADVIQRQGGHEIRAHVVSIMASARMLHPGSSTRGLLSDSACQRAWSREAPSDSGAAEAAPCPPTDL